MRPGNRSSRPGISALALTLMLTLPGCFSPVGSVATSTDSEASTSQPTTGTNTTSGSATTDTSDATQSSGADASTGFTDATASTEPGTGTTTGTTDATTEATSMGPAVCGDGLLQQDEACDDGLNNGDNQPCRGDCTLSICGDGLICSGCAAPETCDDGNQIDDDACDLECQTTSCGDMVVDSGEECDDGNQVVGDGCSPRCLIEQQFVFLTSVKVPANFTGLQAADQLCAVLGAQNFPLRRKFVAWLSDSKTSAGSRIGTSEFPYKLPKGGLIASNTADLLDGAIAVPILETENGTVQVTSLGCDSISGVWTATNAMGQGLADSCGDWTESQGQGLTGNFGLTNGGWSQACNIECTSNLRIYCVERAL